jgi:hypothetical protein
MSWGYLAVILGSSWDHLGYLRPSLGHLGQSWSHFGMILAILDHLRFTLAILGRHLGAILGPCWGYLALCRGEVEKHLVVRSDV